MVEQFPSNSHSKKEKPAGKEPKKVERIVQGNVVHRKKSLGKRFAETFTGGDTQGVGSYILFDVMIPALKDLMADMTSQGVERMLFGDSAPRGRNRRHGGSRTNYSRMSGPLGRAGMADEPRRSISNRGRTTHDFGEVIIPSRVEADAVVEAMFDMLEQYDEVTVADFYTMADITPAFTDEKWGWTDLRGTRLERARGGGYIVNLPRPEPLD